MIEILKGKIQYIKAENNPLSSDVGIIFGRKRLWLFDTGNGERAFSKLSELLEKWNGPISIVLSHFHPDHVGNLESIIELGYPTEIYLSKNTLSYVNRYLKRFDQDKVAAMNLERIIIVDKDIYVEDYFNIDKNASHSIATSFSGEYSDESGHESKDELGKSKMESNIVVSEEEKALGIHIFRIPSSHAKGCLGLEINEDYAFLGDSVYPGTGKGTPYYNPQILYEEIKLLSAIKAKQFLLSHKRPMEHDRDSVIMFLKSLSQ